VFNKTLWPNWCFRCALPTCAYGGNHNYKECKWGDTIQEVAWMVWHNPNLFTKMKEKVPCNLDPVPAGSNTNNTKKKEWFSWLAASDGQNSCNLHSLWLWYFDTQVGPHLRAP